MTPDGYGMYILCCEVCRGAGICRVCKGTGYPPNYTPPTNEQCLAYIEVSKVATGPGKYDVACTQAREQTKAIACLLIVVEGENGSGFSLQTHDPNIASVLPQVLRRVADQIAADTTSLDMQPPS